MIKLICTLIFKLSGWKFNNQLPDEVKACVFIGAPHTSNYDIITTLAVGRLMKRDARFVIKNDWLRFPFKHLFQSMGAIGLDRNALKQSTQKNTDVMADLFKTNKNLVLMISPEGTRKPNDHWKTGFYYIAQKAGVPIILGYGDFKKKEAGIGKVIYPTDFEKDMAEIMDFYRPMQGKIPENFLLDKRFDRL